MKAGQEELVHSLILTSSSQFLLPSFRQGHPEESMKIPSARLKHKLGRGDLECCSCCLTLGCSVSDQSNMHSLCGLWEGRLWLAARWSGLLPSVQFLGHWDPQKSLTLCTPEWLWDSYFHILSEGWIFLDSEPKCYLPECLLFLADHPLPCLPLLPP